MRITAWDDVRHFIIRLLAGKDLVVVGNHSPAGHRGLVFVSPGQKAFIGNSDGFDIKVLDGRLDLLTGKGGDQ